MMTNDKEIKLDEQDVFQDTGAEVSKDEQRLVKVQRLSLDEQTPAGKPANAGSERGDDSSFVSPSDAQNFRTRWNGVQVSFVDDPASSIKQANLLVSDVIEHLTQRFSAGRQQLEQSPEPNGAQESTEQLRLLLRQYRSLFERLASI